MDDIQSNLPKEPIINREAEALFVAMINGYNENKKLEFKISLLEKVILDLSTTILGVNIILNGENGWTNHSIMKVMPKLESSIRRNHEIINKIKDEKNG